MRRCYEGGEHDGEGRKEGRGRRDAQEVQEEAHHHRAGGGATHRRGPRRVPDVLQVLEEGGQAGPGRRGCRPARRDDDQPGRRALPEAEDVAPGDRQRRRGAGRQQGPRHRDQPVQQPVFVVAADQGWPRQVQGAAQGAGRQGLHGQERGRNHGRVLHNVRDPVTRRSLALLRGSSAKNEVFGHYFPEVVPTTYGPVDSRTTSSVASSRCKASRRWRSTRRISRVTAIRPISASGWRTVVSSGCVARARSMSSKPVTERSSGTRKPRWAAAASAPTAALSLNATRAVGRTSLS